METPLGPEDAVGADPLGDADERGDEDDRDARPLNLLGQRSPATRARASRSGEDPGLDALLLHVLGDLSADAGHGLDVRHVPRRDVVVLIQSSNDTVLFEPAR